MKHPTPKIAEQCEKLMDMYRSHRQRSTELEAARETANKCSNLERLAWFKLEDARRELAQLLKGDGE